MAVSPLYEFELMAGWGDVSGLTNVETFTADGRAFFAPTLKDDAILLQPLASGAMFERGYDSVVWEWDLYRAQYEYLYTTLLSNAYSGKVTLQTLRAWDNATYTIYRAYLALPQMSQFQRNYKLYPACACVFTRLALVTP